MGTTPRRTVFSGAASRQPTEVRDRLGPRGLAWLLERVADFGPEDPPWRKGPPVWRPQAQPPPLQLLVPETVMLDAETRLPVGIFFTDCGGFLRGMRRPVRQDPDVFFEACIQLMKSRQQLERDNDAGQEEEEPLCSQSSDAGQRSRSHGTAAPRTPSPGRSPSNASRTLEKEPTTPRAAASFGRGKRGTYHAMSIMAHGKAVVPRSHFPLIGSWRLLFSSGAEEQLSDSDVQVRLASAGDARCSRWPARSRLLQATFWIDGLDFSRCLGVRTTAEYHYEALQNEATGNNPEALHQITTNHFERFRYLDSVSDRARISALPVLISQHLSYQCGLELVSGDFTFERDCKGQLWLTDAKDLFFLYTSGPRHGETAGEQPPPLKMFRYLSEEALNNMPLAEDTGQKCRHMLDLMRDHYDGIRKWNDVDSLLKKREEVLDVNIPVFAGTDLKALAKTFGLGAGQGRTSTAPGRAASTKASEGRRRCPAAPATPRARGVGAQTPRSWAERARAAAEAPAASGHRKGLLPEGAREVGTPRGDAPLVTRTHTMDSLSSPVHNSSGRRGTLWASEPQSPLRRSGSKAVTAANIEIVATAEAQRLVVGCGPGIKPKGPTLDTLVQSAAQTPGAGLQEKRRAEKPTPRLVQVPPGAAASVLAASRAAAGHGHDRRARGRTATKGGPSVGGPGSGGEAAVVAAQLPVG